MTKIIIGCDEALKGDSFGGIVLCGFYFEESKEKELEYLGIDDSKKLNDLKIERISEVLLEKYVDNFVIFEILPEEFNKLTINKNMTEIMNDSYIKIINKLTDKILKKTDNLNQDNIHVVIDQYPGSKKINEIFPKAEIITKAETEYLQVAAASILARYFALKQIQKLSDELKYKLPLGSTHVNIALHHLKEQGVDLSKYAKLNFKNVQEFLK